MGIMPHLNRITLTTLILLRLVFSVAIGILIMKTYCVHLYSGKHDGDIGVRQRSNMDKNEKTTWVIRKHNNNLRLGRIILSCVLKRLPTAQVSEAN